MKSNDKLIHAATATSVATTRRTQRVQIAMPVVVSSLADSAAFKQVTKTASVSAHGCLVRLNSAVVRMQELSIFNPATRQEVTGKVAFIEDTTSIAKDIGIEFSEPSPLFWGISFPPADWDPAERKLPSHAAHPPARPVRQR